jgi:hypothetical protein
MSHGPKKVNMDETGRIIEVVMDEAVTDPNSELAVQALPVERKPHGDRGAQDVVLSADHPDAVQALDPQPHRGLIRLSDEQKEEAAARREAANEARQDTAHAEAAPEDAEHDDEDE